MAKGERARGTTSNMVRVFIQDNTSATGAGLTGLSNTSTNLQITVIREMSAAVTTYKQSGTSNIEAQTTIGAYQPPSTSAKCRFKEVDATNFPGLYEIQFHDDAGHFGTADASKKVQILVKEETTTALKILPSPIEYELTGFNIQDSVRGGMTALPNTTAGAVSGVVINDASNAYTPRSIYDIVNHATYGNSALHTEVAKDNTVSKPGTAQTINPVVSLGTESYAAKGVVPTLSQSIFEILAFIHEKNISSTTMTAKKLDGTTTAYTLTVDDATNPTSITRAT